MFKDLVRFIECSAFYIPYISVLGISEPFSKWCCCYCYYFNAKNEQLFIQYAYVLKQGFSLYEVYSSNENESTTLNIASFR